MLSLNLVHFRAESSFMKETLEKLGITIDAFRRKNYKNAIKTLTDKEFDEHHKESI
jgi:hypothetical protein